MPTRVVTILVAACLVTAACSGNDADGERAAPDAGSSSSAPATTVAEYEPVLDMGPCPDGVPDEPRVECGTLTVPSDRTAPADGDVRLPIVIIRSNDPDPAPDPLVYFSGGPGFDALGSTAFFLEQDFGGRRDVILFDQRGTGRAEPSLDCPEITEVVWEVLGAARTSDEEAAAAHDALTACRERLEGDGIDLDDYDTPTTADDADDLRATLGAAEWNLLGVSYGTTVALEVLRRHGDAVRAAVLDAVYPPDVPASIERFARNARRALDLLTDGCAADPACAARFGDVDAEFDALLAEWDADPYEHDVVDGRTGENRHLVLTGGDVVAGLWNAMYDSSLIPLLPSVIEALRARNDFAKAIVEELAGSGVSRLIDSAEAMALSVNCADRAELGDGPPLEEVVAADPQLAGLINLAAVTQQCTSWSVEPVDGAFNEIVETEVPTLVMGNEYDPVTPPDASERTAEALGGAPFLLFPGLGHGAVFAAECPESIFRAFLEDPTAPVDDACIAEMGPPAWAGT